MDKIGHILSKLYFRTYSNKVSKHKKRNGLYVKEDGYPLDEYDQNTSRSKDKKWITHGIENLG